MNASRIHPYVLVSFLAALLVITGFNGVAAEITPDDDPGSPVGRSQLSEAHFLFNAVFNNGDAKAAAELVAPGAVIQTPYGEFEGPEGLLDYVAIVRRAYPDASFEIIRITGSAGSLVVEWVMTATTFVRDPVGQLESLQIERDGVATIGFGEVGISVLELEYGAVVATAPGDDYAYTPARGDNY